MDYFFVFFGCGIPYKWDFIAVPDNDNTMTKGTFF